jgi:ribosomal protein S18 acetylase RimI-like enzyme
MFIRPLTPKDVPLFKAWRNPEQDGDLEYLLELEIEEHFSGKRTLFVGELNGQLVGTIQLVYKHTDPAMADGDSSAYLQALEVHPEFRRRGLAVLLLERLEAEAKKNRFVRLTLMVEPDNQAALKLYARQGYKPFKQGQDSWQGEPYRTVCLEKLLA